MGTAGPSRRPLRRVAEESREPCPRAAWPATIPAVRDLLDHGLELGALTVIVGENGSGKSTLVEGMALAFGLSAEGGSIMARHTTRASESVLHQHLRLTRGAGAARWGYFVRAETMHGFYSYLEDNPSPRGDIKFHEMSHGESLLALVESRFGAPGLYVMDEPEAGLSFTSTVALATSLADIARSSRSQAIVATHSPILAAVEGAALYETGPWGLRRARWRDLQLVDHWRRFLTDPSRYFDD